MAFDLATAKPVEPPRPGGQGGFDPTTARPVAPAQPAAGLAPPAMLPRAEIPVDPTLTAPPGVQPVTTPQQDAAGAIMARENPIAEKVLGAVEGALDIAAKVIGGTVGGLGGAYSAPFRGQAMDAGFAEGGAAGVDVARQGLGLLRLGSGQGPRTPTGQAITEGADTVLQNLPAAGGVYGTVAGPAMNAGAAARQAAAPVAQVARQGLDMAGGALQRGAAVAQGLRRTPEPIAPTAGTPGSAGAAGADMATTRRERARNLPVPFEGDAALTEGQATRSFEGQRFERETAKDPELGRQLRERAAEQNQVALRNLDALEEFTGAKTADRGASGQAVVDAIAGKAQRAKAEIDKAYSAARDAGDMAEPVDATPLAQWIEDNRSSAGNAGVIGTAEAELVRLGGAQKAGDGSLVPREITINDLEELRKKIVAGGKKDPTNAHFAGQINAAIDAMTEGRGGNLYKAARAKFRDYQSEFKERGAIRDIIGIKKGTSDRITATEKVLERAMRSADDLRNVRETLITAGDDGKQAWREVQGQAMRKLRDEVTKGVATDIRGNPIVSPAKLKQVIDGWDQGGQLEVLFGKKGAETLRDLRDVGQDLFTAPPGAVNTSNTASVIAKWMADSAASFVATGVPAPLIGLTKAAWKARSDRQVKKQVQKALGPAEPPAPRAQPPRNPLEGSDALPPSPSPAPKPAAPKAAAAPRETPADPRLQDIEALRADATPEVARVLDAEAKRVRSELAAKTTAATREREVEALERAARATSNASVRRALQARADALRAEKIPTGDARELDAVPASAGDKIGRVPAADATELTREQLAQLKPTKRERDLLALRQDATDPEVVKDLDRAIAAERKRAADARRGEEYLRLAEKATDPELRAGFEAKAKKLGAVRRDDPIPQPEVTELAVETIEPAGQAPNFDPTPEQLATWKRENKFGALDAQAAQDVDTALKYDADAVKRATQQLERSPEAYRREIARIIEEGKARESQAEPPAGRSTPAAGDQGRQRPSGEGGEDPGGGAPVTPGGGRPRAPDGQGGGGGQARPEELAGPTERALAKAREDFDRDTRPTGNPLTDRLSEKLRADYEGARREYDQLPDSRGGLVLNTDTARELSPDYLADRTRSADVHEPASAFIKRVYAEKLAAPTPEGRERVVLFSAGGTGAGKSSSLQALGDTVGSPEITYDTNMNKMASAIEKIDQALAAGRDVRVFYVYADPVQSFDQAISRTLSQKAKFGSGRTVPIEEHIKTHVGASRVVRDLADRYRNDLRVEFQAVDNSRGRGMVRPAGLAELPLVADNGLREQLEAIAREAHRSGRIDAATLAGYLGEQAPGVRVESVGRQGLRNDQPGAAPRDGQGQEGRLEAVGSLADEAGEGAPPPTPGTPFVVYRLGSTGKLSGRNAANSRGLASFLARFDDYDRPQSNSAGSDRVTAYRVVVREPFGPYQKSDGGRGTSGTAVGRLDEGGAGISYSFPADGAWEATPIATVPISTLRARVAEVSGGIDNFDYPGTLEVQRIIRAELSAAGRPTAPAPKPQIRGAVGGSTSVVTERGLRVPVRYRLVDVGDLITSHSDDLKVNPAFPQEFQPRDRTRASSEAQIARMQNALQPELLAESPKASDGAPILGIGDGVVLSGNARTIALRRAYAGGQADGYRAWLEQNAERFGLTPEQVRSVDRPVLVRESTVELDRADFARQANESTVAAMSDAEQAFADAPQLPDLEQLVTNDDGTVNALRSAAFIRDFMRTVASPAERGQLMTADGRPSQRLLTRIRNAVFALAYGDADLVARMSESIDGNTRNLLGGLLRAAGDVAKLRELADSGARRTPDFVPDLVEAARRYTALRQDGMTVEQGLAQGDLLGGAAPPRVAELMREIEVNARAQRRIADMVLRLTNQADAQGDPRQGGLDL